MPTSPVPSCPEPSLWPPNTEPTPPCLAQLRQGCCCVLSALLWPKFALYDMNLLFPLSTLSLLDFQEQLPLLFRKSACVRLPQLLWPITAAPWRTQVFSPLVQEIRGPKSAFPNSKLRVSAMLLPSRFWGESLLSCLLQFLVTTMPCCLLCHLQGPSLYSLLPSSHHLLWPWPFMVALVESLGVNISRTAVLYISVPGTSPLNWVSQRQWCGYPFCLPVSVCTRLWKPRCWKRHLGSYWLPLDPSSPIYGSVLSSDDEGSQSKSSQSS